jgi:hypothetical protein
MTKKSNNKKATIIPDSPEEFRDVIKRITHEELKGFNKTELQKIYERSKEVYDDSNKRISRQERQTLYHVQERLFGKLDPAITSSLERIGETLATNPRARKKAINYNIPNTGAVIVKDWKGKKLEVKIVDGGFEYKGKPYKSLSRLAKEISGYAVSGPVFFGLRKAKESVGK